MSLGSVCSNVIRRANDFEVPSNRINPHSKNVNIHIDAQGRIQIGGEDVVPAALVERLKGAMKEANNDNIIIQAHVDCAQEHVVLVVDAAKAADVAGIAFAKEEAL